MRRNTLSVTTRHHTVPESQQLNLVKESLRDIKRQLQNIIKQHYSIKNAMTLIRFFAYPLHLLAVKQYQPVLNHPLTLRILYDISF
jgi:hypothetical protein